MYKMLYLTVNASSECTKFCTMHLIAYPEVVYKVATDAILIQTRCVQSVVSLEILFILQVSHTAVWCIGQYTTNP